MRSSILTASLLTLVALGLGGCGDDSETATSTTEASTTTVAETTTTRSKVKDTDKSRDSDATQECGLPPETSGRPGVPDTAPLPSPTDDELGPGVHAAYLQAIDIPSATVGVDVIQFLTGEQANDAYAEETGDESGVPNDYFIVNNSATVRTLDLADDVVVCTVQLDVDGDSDSDPATLEGLRDYLGGFEGTDFSVPFWIVVDDGVVAQIEEQFIP